MLAVATRRFRDAETGEIREAGERFDATAARIKRLASLGLAESLEKPKGKRKEQ